LEETGRLDEQERLWEMKKTGAPGKLTPHGVRVGRGKEELGMQKSSARLENLKRVLQRLGSVVIAYSGGTDSTFLLKVAHDVLGDRVLAVTAQSETYTEEEGREARKLARMIGVRHRLIETAECRDDLFLANSPQRCYYCKKELFSNLVDLAGREGYQYVCDGSNLDDGRDFRPGEEAGRQLGVRSPLKETGFSKAEVRAFSRRFGLPTWNKQPLACLASRFPYGERITMEKLRQVGKAEDTLLRLGAKQCRVRHYGPTARIEVDEKSLPILVRPQVRRSVVRKFKELGFTYVSLDLEGYRTGSMNEVLERTLLKTKE
jgi:uncharacterized protein